jgi:hypothetical protein
VLSSVLALVLPQRKVDSADLAKWSMIGATLLTGPQVVLAQSFAVPLE